MTALLASIQFVDVTAAAGIHWSHDNGASGRRYIVETFGGGVLVFDYDGDGLPDLYFIDSGPLPGSTEPGRGGALYRNGGDGTFTDVTARAGLKVRGYGMGGAAADVDNDGDVDVFLTSFGPETFFVNNGDGTFQEHDRSGASDSAWSTSAAFFELDGDGFVDLYVANYLDFTLERHKRCTSPTRGIESYCHPEEYAGVADRLYRNRADLSFEDVSAVSGVEASSAGGKGLGVVASDYDGDGDSDLYVANDTTRNFLFRNDGRGRLTEVGLASGVAYNEEGRPEAGMGTDWGDLDRDGLFDLVVTNFDFERNTVYRNLGNGFFMDATSAFGVGDRSLTELGFGCDLADFDNDGWTDLVVTNGHILDNIAEIQTNLSYAQPGQFFANAGGQLRDESEPSAQRAPTLREMSVGAALRRKRVGRGLATLDFDRDGDLDLALSSNGRAAELFSNEGGDRNGWLAIHLVGVESNRNGIGARIEAQSGSARSVEEVRAGSSYLSQNEMGVYFGLGRATAVDVTIRWPSGKRDVLGRLSGRKRYVVKEGVGVLNP